MSEYAKTVGVMGGLGPAACVDFMATVLRLTPTDKEQDHIHMLVDQNPHVPNRQDAILRGGQSPAGELAAMATRLSKSGCDFIVMPCNTAHAFEAEIRAASTVPFVSIIDVTIDALPVAAGTIGVLATPACMRAGMFQSALARKGLDVIELSEQQLDVMMEFVLAIKDGSTGEPVRQGVIGLADELISHGAEAIIIGCTELQIVLTQDDVDVPLVSSADELAKTSIAMARGKLPLATES